MAVRNQRKSGAQGDYPSRSHKAPSMGMPPHNPEPTTTRGRRRSAETDEYKKNLETRKSQSYGNRLRGRGR